MHYAVDWVDRIDFATLRRYRTNNLQQKLKEYDLDALITFRAEYIRYMTGLRPLWWPISFLSRNASIIAQSGSPVLYVTSGDHARCQATMNWLPKEDIRPCGTMEDSGIAHTMVREEFVPTLRQMGVTEGRIGIDASIMSVFFELKKALPKAELMDGSDAVRDAASIKHPEEIKCMRISNRMAEIAHETANRAIHVGVRECEVLAEVMHTFYSFGMEVPQCNLIVASGENTAPLHRFASDKPIRRGDLVFMDLGGCFNGYFSDVTRTVCLGEPNDQQIRIYNACYEAMMTAHEVMRPGITNVEVNRLVRQTISKHGLVGYHGVLGHTIGVTAFDAPLIGELAAIGEKEFELKPDMTFSVEPTITVPGVAGGGGVRLEDCVLITETGNEVLSKSPYCDKLLGNGVCVCCID